MNLWSFLLNGSDALTLPKDWLADTERLAEYEAFTERQSISMVQRRSAALKAENARIVAEREERLKHMQPSKVVRPSFGGRRVGQRCE